MRKILTTFNIVLWGSISLASPHSSLSTQNIQIKHFIENTSSISCDSSGIYCIATAWDKQTLRDVAYVTQDAGDNWHQTIAFTPFNNPQVNIEKYTTTEISCDESNIHCMVVQLGIVNKIPRPIIYTTHDGGLSWSDPTILNTPLSSKERKILSEEHNEQISSNIKVDCHLPTLACTVIGSVYSQKALFPFIYSTTDGGQNWNLAKSLEEPSHSAPTSGFHGTFLKDVACDESGIKCITVGFTMARNSISNSFYASLPVVYISTNGGKKWNNPIILPTKMNINHANLLTNIACSSSGKFCTTMGVTYHGDTDRSQVFSFSTQDGGRTWSKKVLVPSNERSEFPYAMTCDKNNARCIAVGYYQVYQRHYSVSKPVYYVSSNSNKVWEKSISTLPSSTIFNDVACDAALTSCIVVGSNTELQKSLLAMKAIKTKIT